MTLIENPVLLAEELNNRGIPACHEILYAPHGYQEGVEVANEFYPMWELNLPENMDAVASFDFESIKARRSRDWSVVPPQARR